jgi:hypothetical protein
MVDWLASGLSEHDVEDAVGFGLTPEDVARWAPFYPLEIHWAVRHGLPLEVARQWAERGVRIRDTIHARAVGLSLEDLEPWLEQGFLPADAWESTEAGVSIETAIAWRAAGFIVPDALLLIGDGWTLDEAIRARYAGVDRYGIGAADPSDRQFPVDTAGRRP